MKFLTASGAVLLPLASVVSAIDLKSDDEASIKSCSSQYAHGLMSLYKNNATDLPESEIGVFPKPYYWWESGAVWGGLVEYTAITGDESYVKTVQQGLSSSYGPANNYIRPDKKDQTGNDDQAFWCLATMSAAEYGFPEPEKASASYLQVTENCFNDIIARWDSSTCDGGLRWQVYPDSVNGMDYKNSISNGAAFALGARLARYTGNQTYADWAVKIYDWTKKVGLIGDKFEVFDGTSSQANCAEVADKTEWTYNNAMFLHGSAFMSDHTKESTWKDRTDGFLDRAATFFENPEQAENVMFEACENATPSKCNLDQQSFKAYLSRWMAKTAVLVPSTKQKIVTYLTKSAVGAAGSCTGGGDGVTCGSKWYTGGFDGQTGVGQQLSALEVTQALLYIQQGILPGTGSEAQPKPSAKPSAQPSAKPSSSAAVSSEKAPTSEKPYSTAAPSSAAAPSTDAKPTPSAESSVVAPSASAKTESSEAANTPAPSSTPKTTQPGGEFGEQKPNSTASVTSCATKSTVTVYVPPTTPVTTASVAPSASAPVAPPANSTVPVTPPTNSTVPVTPPTNSTVPVAPPLNSTSPELFPGAASNVKMAGSTLFAAAALAVMAALL